MTNLSFVEPWIAPAVAWDLGGRLHRLVQGLATWIVWFAVAACLALGLIYLMQLCHPRRRR